MGRRRRDDVDAAVLRALLDRDDDGLTIFELRSQVDADIGEIERSLERLKARGHIEADRDTGRACIRPTDAARAVVDVDAGDDSLFDRIRERLPF